MILCFSGTGNSRFVADALAERLGEEIISINEVLKENLHREFESDTPYIIVAPIYAWRLPGVVEELVYTSKFEGNNKIYFVVTMGAQTGKADLYSYGICEMIGMEFCGLRGIPMPDNYVSLSKMADEETVKKFLDEALIQVDEIAADIKAGNTIVKTDKTPLAGLLSGKVNEMFSKYAMSDKNMNVNDTCVGCKTCEQVCPVNNVHVYDGRPMFHGQCISCYACIHHCPNQSINIGKKTINHGRYVCPKYSEYTGNK